MPTQYLLPGPLAQALLDYLSTRPYNEVYQLISAVQVLPTHEEPNEIELTGVGSQEAPAQSD